MLNFTTLLCGLMMCKSIATRQFPTVIKIEYNIAGIKVHLNPQENSPNTLPS